MYSLQAFQCQKIAGKNRGILFRPGSAATLYWYWHVTSSQLLQNPMTNIFWCR